MRYTFRLQVVVGLLLAVLFCVMCLAIGGLFIVESVFCIRDAHYPSTTAKITYSSDISMYHGKYWEGLIYSRLINHQYTVGSQFYFGEAFPEGTSEGALSKFTPGGNVLVGYNPRLPDDSFLKPLLFPWP